MRVVPLLFVAVCACTASESFDGDLVQFDMSTPKSWVELLAGPFRSGQTFSSDDGCDTTLSVYPDGGVLVATTFAGGRVLSGRVTEKSLYWSLTNYDSYAGRLVSSGVSFENGGSLQRAGHRQFMVEHGVGDETFRCGNFRW